MQLPTLRLERARFEDHLERTFGVCQAKAAEKLSYEAYLAGLYALDWYVACCCLDGIGSAWEFLFATRAGHTDCLLVDALRSRAVRLYPRNEERQENAVDEFWSHLLVADHPGSVPILARYDGQRPLVPWLIRVFQNWHISQLRQRSGVAPLNEDDASEPQPSTDSDHWHEVFRSTAAEELEKLSENETLILGLRLRYRLSQREVAQLLGVHEGTISRQTTHFRDRCLQSIGDRLRSLGWTGDDLMEFILTEMGSLLLDEPKLAANRLARILAVRGKKLPEE